MSFKHTVMTKHHYTFTWMEHEQEYSIHSMRISKMGLISVNRGHSLLCYFHNWSLQRNSAHWDSNGTPFHSDLSVVRL